MAISSAPTGGVIVMGVSGSGKTTIGAMLASKLGAKFIDGDDLHPKANILKMSKAQPLSDDDRLPWLERIRDAAFSLGFKNEVGVIVCSALKKSYRDSIREGNEKLTFIFLDGDYNLIRRRLSARKGHFMKPGMLESQFAILERPQRSEEDVITVSIDGPVEAVVEQTLKLMRSALGYG